MTTLNEEIENIYTLPDEFLDGIRAADLVVVPPSTWSFRRLQPLLERTYSLSTLQTSVLGKPGFDVYTSVNYGYGRDIRADTSERISSSLAAGGLRYIWITTDGTLYMAVQHLTGPYLTVPTNGTLVNCIVITPPSQPDHRMYNEFKYSASGVLHRILRPIADKVGLVIGPDKFSYKVTATGLGHTIVQEQGMEDVYASIISMLLIGKMYPVWAGGYGHVTVEALFERTLLDCPVASPETIGFDRSTFEYTGDPTLLQDTAFNGLVQYIRTCPEHVKQTLLARDTASTGRALKAAFAVAPSFVEKIDKAKSKAQNGITVKAAVSKVLASLQGTAIQKNLHESLAALVACGDNITVVLGSSLDVVRGMALRAADKLQVPWVETTSETQTVVR